MLSRKHFYKVFVLTQIIFLLLVRTAFTSEDNNRAKNTLLMYFIEQESKNKEDKLRLKDTEPDTGTTETSHSSSQIISITPVVEEKKEEKEEKKQIKIDEPIVSVSAFGKRLGDVLLEICSDIGYTVIFGPQVDPNIPVVVNLKSVPLSQAINAITAYVNYGYNIKPESRTLTIQKVITKTFTIPEAAINVPIMSAEMGGDMIGSSGGASVGAGFPGSSGGVDTGGQNLKASITVKKTDDKIDGRKAFEDNIRKFLSQDGHYVIDWLSALLIVTDSPRNIELIEHYINDIKKTTSKQLVVNAIITQVATKKEYRFGIDWDILAKRLGGEVLSRPDANQLRITSNVTDIPSPTLTITRTAADVSAVLKALEQQGDVKVVANPYLYVRNLQAVPIFSGKTIPYIGSIQKSVTGASGESTTSFSLARAQDGIMLAVKCHIRDDGDIDVQIAPILTSVDEFVTFNIENSIFTNPVSSVQQTLQNVTLKDGETIVIGGVKREKKEISEKGVPILSKIPILGGIFSSKGDVNDTSELVIALKVKKVDNTEGQKN